MPAHTIDATLASLHGRFSTAATPILSIDPGDTVTVRNIPDVSWGLGPPTSTTAPRPKVEGRDPAKHNGPCLVGPIEIRGVRRGEAIAIYLERIVPGPWGWTYAGRGMASPAMNSALGIGDAPLTLLRWELDRDRDIATNHLGHSVPLAPFLGTIGLAPDADDADAWTPRACGGNMDCRELIAGSTLLLPVLADRALLSLGDGHAAQGDGELSGTAIECPIEEVRLRIERAPGVVITTPRAHTPAGDLTLGFAETLDDAALIAAAAMLDLICERLAISRAEAVALTSSLVSLRITQSVNPHRGIHAICPKMVR